MPNTQKSVKEVAMAKKKKIAWIAGINILFVLLVTWIAWSNTALELNTYIVTSDRLPGAFDGYRIAHVSDLHNTEMGKDNEKLLFITGDMIDSRNTSVEIALEFVEEAMKIAPCYYVTGNHEARVSEYADLKEGLTELGVVVLADESIELERDGEQIALIGVDDPSFDTDYLFGDAETVMKAKLHELTDEDDSYAVLLSHRPELFDVYVESSVDLILSGHAHGGQFRLPFVGGLVAPNQGFFPEYDAGLYREENTNMLVSRGVGNSILPFRINNRPEVILIELQAE